MEFPFINTSIRDLFRIIEYKEEGAAHVNSSFFISFSNLFVLRSEGSENTINRDP